MILRGFSIRGADGGDQRSESRMAGRWLAESGSFPFTERSISCRESLSVAVIGEVAQLFFAFQAHLLKPGTITEKTTKLFRFLYSSHIAEFR